MARFGLCGPTYSSLSPNVDAERCLNLFPETVESPGGKSAIALYPTPGLLTAWQIATTAVLGTFQCQPNGSTTDRFFAIGQSGVNQTLWELVPNQPPINRGKLTAPVSSSVSMQHNGLQLAICTGGQIWIFTFATNVLSGPISTNFTNNLILDYSDGFFIAVQANSNKFQVSALLDGTTWPGLSVGQVSEFPDNIIGMKVNQRGIWFLGRKATVPYFNSGAINVPFTPIQGVFIEDGCAATFAVVRVDNSLFWLDQNERGGITARRANGYTPQRISHHGVEAIWATYSTVADAISYAFEMNGHTFWHIYFPSGTSFDSNVANGASWRYDVATQMWHEVAFWNTTKGHFEAHHSQNHAFAFGNHYVGDWSTGNVYQMAMPLLATTGIGYGQGGEGQVPYGGGTGNLAWTFCDDNGSPIRRLRRAPNVGNENQFYDIPYIEFDIESGLGPIPGLVGQEDPTYFTLQDSTTGKLYTLSIGDDGRLITTLQIAQLTVSPIILNDPTNAASWQLGIEGGGPRGTDQLAQVANYPNSMRMVSISGRQIWSLQTKLNGDLFTAPLGPVLRGAQLMFRFSKDHAHTWTDYFQLNAGKAGEFTKRVRKRRLGRVKNFVAEISWSDPVPLRIVDAYIPPPQERLAKQYAKIT